MPLQALIPSGAMTASISPGSTSGPGRCRVRAGSVRSFPSGTSVAREALPPWRPGADVADRLGGARPGWRTQLQTDADDARDDTRPPARSLARVRRTPAPPAQVAGALGAAAVPGDAPRLLRSAPFAAPRPRFPRRPAPRAAARLPSPRAARRGQAVRTWRLSPARCCG